MEKSDSSTQRGTYISNEEKKINTFIGILGIFIVIFVSIFV